MVLLNRKFNYYQNAVAEVNASIIPEHFRKNIALYRE